MASITLYPSSYVNVSTGPISNIENAYRATASSGNYAEIGLTVGGGATTEFYYVFDTSDIPPYAIIDNVTCTIGIYISTTSTSYVLSRSVLMCSGSIKKGVESTNISTTASSVTINCGTWTRDELNDCRIGVFATRGTSSVTNSRYFRVYGSTLTVNYTLPDKIDISSIIRGKGTSDQPNLISLYKTLNIEYILTPNNNETLYKIYDNGIDVTDWRYHHTITVIDIPARNIIDSDFSLTLRGTSSYGFTNKGTLQYTASITVQGNNEAAGCTRFTTNFDRAVQLHLSITIPEITNDYIYIGNLNTPLPTDTTLPSVNTYQWSTAGASIKASMLYSFEVPAGNQYFDIYLYHAKTKNTTTASIVFSGEVPPATHEEELENVFCYGIDNILENHDVIFIFTGYGFYRKTSSGWELYSKVWKKINGNWQELILLENLLDPSANYERFVI